MVIGAVGPAVAAPPDEVEAIVADIDAARISASSTSGGEEFAAVPTLVDVDAATGLEISPDYAAYGLEAALPTISVDHIENVVAETSESGSQIFSDSSSQDKVAVQGNDAGDVSLTFIAENAEAAKDLRFSVDDSTIVSKNADGSLTLTTESVMEDGAVYATDVQVDAPWAADADGDPLETHYVASGQTVQQIVITDKDTEYPIVADPTLRWGKGSVSFVMRLSKSEVKKLNPTIQKSIGAPALCGLAPKPIAVACGAIGATKWASIRTAFSTASKHGACVELQFKPVILPAQWYMSKVWTTYC